MARISIFGIGYVGAVSAACLANDGHDVIAVDTNPAIVDCVNSGNSPIVEAGLKDLISLGVAAGRLTGTTNFASAIFVSDISLVCVGTPSAESGAIGTAYIEAVCEQIGSEIAKKPSFHSVVVRSTIVPGTMDNLCIPLLEKASGKIAGKDFGVGYYPEFLREGTAIKDYYDPGLIVFAALDGTTEGHLKSITADMPVPAHAVSLATAEAVKYANNAWRAVKVTFANEIGNLAKACGIDGHEVMDLICRDTRVNISPAFLRPGFAFGGSCLPKDLRALRHLAKEKQVPLMLLDAVLAANEQQIDKAEQMVESAGGGSIGFVGLSFKPGTDDVRESPLLELAKRLFRRGYAIKIYDPNVGAAHQSGARANSFEALLPDFGKRLVKSIDELISGSDVILVGNRYDETLAPLGAASLKKRMIDLTRIDRNFRSNGLYEGICW